MPRGVARRDCSDWRKLEGDAFSAKRRGIALAPRDFLVLKLYEKKIAGELHLLFLRALPKLPRNGFTGLVLFDG